MHTLEDCIRDIGEIPLCQCGCNKKVNINPKYYSRYKRLGYPEFINYHNTKGKHWNWSEEAKLKMSESQKEYYKHHKSSMYGKTGENNHLFGKHQSEEHKRKRLEARKEYYRLNPEEIKKGKDHPLYRKPLSEEYTKLIIEKYENGVSTQKIANELDLKDISSSRIYRFLIDNNIKTRNNSESHIGLQVGDNNPNYGKHWSEDILKKISMGLIGKMSGKLNPMYVGLTRLPSADVIQHNFNIRSALICFKTMKLCKNKSVP